MMGMVLSQSHRMVQTQRQSQEQKLAQKYFLTQILSIRQIFHHPEFPAAAKGLEGIRIADGILKRRESTGVLIGGLAEHIWYEKVNEKDLRASPHRQ